MTDRNGTPAVRHLLPDRLFHWVMAVCVIVLGATAFLPIVGFRFDWVPVHWMTGIVLTLAVLFHLYRVFVVHGIGGMLPGGDDAREAVRAIKGCGSEGLSPAKYDAFQKAYHLAAALTVLVLLATGLVMLAKIDTIFWRRDPSILTDATWGAVYVLHGLGAMALLFLVILHVYFSLLPEHRDILAAMIRGHGPELSRKGTE